MKLKKNQTLELAPSIKLTRDLAERERKKAARRAYLATKRANALNKNKK